MKALRLISFFIVLITGVGAFGALIVKCLQDPEMNLVFVIFLLVLFSLAIGVIADSINKLNS